MTGVVTDQGRSKTIWTEDSPRELTEQERSEIESLLRQQARGEARRVYRRMTSASLNASFKIIKAMDAALRSA